MPRKVNKPQPITEKTRQEDEKLRRELDNADLKKFDKAMDKLMKPGGTERGGRKE
jgi:hypothetical protein